MRAGETDQNFNAIIRLAAAAHPEVRSAVSEHMKT
jgi:hypothetical protein